MSPGCGGGHARRALALALVLVLALAALVTSVPGGATALTLVEDARLEDGSRLVRLALDQDQATYQGLDGQVRVNGTNVPEARTAVPQEPVPWRGFPATLLLHLSGNGTVLLADGASGLALGVGHGEGHAGHGASSAEADRTEGNRSLAPDAPGNGTGEPSNASATASTQTTDPAETGDTSTDPSPLRSSDPRAEGESLPWRWIALGVGGVLVLVALVVEMSQTVRLRIAHVGWFLARVWSQRRKR